MLDIGQQNSDYPPQWLRKDLSAPISRWMTSLLNWVLSILRFEEPESNVVYWNPEIAREKRHFQRGAEEDEKEQTLEEEIMHMEKHRRELIRKVGGEKYNKALARLIRRKQRRYRNRGQDTLES